MEKQQLLNTLNALISRYQMHRQYIDKARNQIGKFRAAVIEKVILDNEIKSSSVADDVNPLLPLLHAESGTLQKEQSGLVASKGSVDDVVQELELRMLIGEMEADAFEQEVSDLRERQGQTAARLAEIDAELNTFSGVMDTWAALAGPAGHYTAPAPVAVPEPVAEAPASVEPESTLFIDPVVTDPVVTDPVVADPVVTDPVVTDPVVTDPVVADPVVADPVVADPVVADPVVADAAEPLADPVALDVGVEVDPEPTPEPQRSIRPMAKPNKDEHFSISKMQEDVGVLTPAPVAAISIRMEEEMPIETGEVNEDAQSDIHFSLNDGFDVSDMAGGQDVVPGNRSGEVEIDFEVNGADAARVDEKSGQRRALLLYQEGTADEQIYPFTGDTLTVGRGRENDIQIKNDSKVSRYHCRISRRGGNFYIEDVKSSNGTLVNGELITERRLFGGEEVIIGETFFRFRIME